MWQKIKDFFSKSKGWIFIGLWFLALVGVVIAIRFIVNMLSQDYESLSEMRRYESDVRKKIQKWQSFVDDHPSYPDSGN